MKKQFFTLIMTLLPLLASADAVNINGINYNLSSETKTAEVTENWDSDGFSLYTGKIVIPETVEYNGTTYSVTTIGSYAFHDCQNLTSIKIPGSVTSLDLGAFCGCRDLTSIEISDGLTEIGSFAFGGCLNLKSISIPNSVKTILPYAFENCWALTSVKIPSSVTHIEYGVFSGCRELASIVVDKNNPVYDSREGCNAIISTNDNELIAGCKNTVIPNSVTAIRDFAFYNCQNLTSITIPRSVREICDNAFFGCTGLKEVISYVTKPFSFDESAFSITDDDDPWFNKFTSATLYVPIGTKDKYKATEGWNKFRNIVEIEMVVPIEDEMAVSTESLGSENLSDNIVGGVYYNMGTESYDSTDGSIVISQSTDMEEIDDATPGSNDVKRNFEGIILQVAPGQGTITVNAKTSGNAQLGVQVGYDTPTIATQSEQGDVVVNYDVAEETYVYIYSYSDSNEARKTRTSSDDVVKIYGITIKPGTVGIAEVKRDVVGQNRYYTLEGRLINGKPVAKGIYIVNGRKIVMK